MRTGAEGAEKPTVVVAGAASVTTSAGGRPALLLPALALLALWREGGRRDDDAKKHTAELLLSERAPGVAALALTRRGCPPDADAPTETGGVVASDDMRLSLSRVETPPMTQPFFVSLFACSFVGRERNGGSRGRVVVQVSDVCEGLRC